MCVYISIFSIISQEPRIASKPRILQSKQTLPRSNAAEKLVRAQGLDFLHYGMCMGSSLRAARCGTTYLGADAAAWVLSHCVPQQRSTMVSEMLERHATKARF